MDFKPDELRRHYEEASDAALLRAADQWDGFTPEAQAVIDAELRRRGLTVSEPAPKSELRIDDAPKWITVDRFRDLSVAIVARGALEAAGISCFLRDENTVRLDWQISNMIGGMRLQVQEQDRDAALTVLRHLTPAESGQEADALLAGDLCPFCGSPEIHRVERGLGMRAAALWMLSLPLPRGRHYWRCDSCGRQFEESELEASERQSAS